MATTETVPPAHLHASHSSRRTAAAQPIQQPPQRPRGQSYPFDPEDLVRKLEAHRNELLARERRFSGYKPRHAAQQFAATTVPLKDKRDHQRQYQADGSDKHNMPKRTASNPHRNKPVDFSTAPGADNLNPKQMHAALHLDMIPSKGRPDGRRESTGSIPLKQKDETSPRNRKTSAPIKPTNEPAPARGYRPGDAAKRLSLQPTNKPSGLFDDFSFPSNTDEFEFRLNRFITDDTPYDPQPLPDVDEETGRATPPPTVRPKLNPNDRHNWAQQSQCGDDMRNLLHMPSVLSRNKDKGEAKPTAAAAQATLAQLAASGVEPIQPRKKTSLPPPPANNLVSDAVQRIKTEEKIKRRKSLIGFFKRF